MGTIALSIALSIGPTIRHTDHGMDTGTTTIVRTTTAIAGTSGPMAPASISDSKLRPILNIVRFNFDVSLSPASLWWGSLYFLTESECVPFQKR